MTTNSIDRRIGLKLKLRRNYLGITQSNLGNMIGVTFQQIQKYEKGINKISISKLKEISKILRISIDYFLNEEYNIVDSFKDAETTENNAEDKNNYFSTNDKNHISDKEIINLIKSFQRIKDKKVRDIILNLVDSLGLKNNDRKDNS
ncbi:MAG: helix-turn-helix domain-containing protein [Rickettsiales bacterium]|jgi:transcriptional regulator with XRE-family HTH domain|nr:helix-turn-helix domain-containing protein [Rickettsiales bacterium]